MSSLYDLADVPGVINRWEEGQGYRGLYGIEAERAMVADIQRAISILVRQGEEVNTLAERLENAKELNSAAYDEQYGYLDGEQDEAAARETDLDQAVRLDRQARTQAKLAREGLRQQLIESYKQGVSKTTLSDASGVTRQTLDRWLGQWQRKPPIADDIATPITLF